MSWGITNADIWNEQWKNIFDHYQQDIRHAYYIRAILNENEHKLLEIAAGSFRDIGALNKWGYNCYGVDYSEEAIFQAQKYFSSYRNKIFNMNAFNLDFPDKIFDLSYHNGFWTYFDDNDIEKLLKEQARVTKNRVIVTVHNKHNSEFVDYFKRLSQQDPLYNLRFFEVNEISELMKTVCRDVYIIPVGKGKKYYEDDLINIGLGDAQYIKRSFDYHKLNLLPVSERLMCIGQL